MGRRMEEWDERGEGPEEGRERKGGGREEGIRKEKGRRSSSNLPHTATPTLLYQPHPLHCACSVKMWGWLDYEVDACQQVALRPTGRRKEQALWCQRKEEPC